MKSTSPTYIYPKGAKILYSSWSPANKEGHVVFRCGTCGTIFSHHSSMLTSGKPLRCDECKTMYHVGMKDAVAIQKKIQRMSS